MVASGKFSMPKLASVIVGGVFLLLTACGGPNVVATFQAEGNVISIEQVSAAGSHNTYAVRVGSHPVLPLEGYTSVHVDSIWNQSATSLVMLSGATDACPSRYTVVLATKTDASAHVIGDCGEIYRLAENDDGLTIRQDDAHAPKIWTLKDGVLDGPIIQQARKVKAAPARTAVHSGEEAAGALAPPPVSQPVGDDVIPSPIGQPGSANGRQNERSPF
jgi:hypothetical protein